MVHLIITWCMFASNAAACTYAANHLVLLLLLLLLLLLDRLTALSSSTCRLPVV